MDNSRAAAYPLMLADFGLVNSQGALFFSITSGAHLISTLGARWWLPRWRPMGGMSRFLFLLALAGFAIGVSARVSWGLPLLWTAAALLGIAMGGLAVCQNALVAMATPEKYRRQAYSGLHMMYGLSSLLAPLWMARMVREGGSWPLGFWSVSLPPLLLAFVAVVLTRRAPATLSEPNSGEKPALPVAAQYVIALVLGLYVVAEVGLSSRLVLLGVRELGLNQDGASDLLSQFFLGLMAGRLLLGLRSWPISSRNLLLVSGLASLAAMAVGLSGWSQALGWCGLLMAPFFPTAMAWMAEFLPTRVESTTSIIMVLQGVLLMAMHLLLGWLEEWVSVTGALWLGVGSLAACLLLILLLLRPPKSLSVT